jgi:hypothetical protein
MTEPVARTWQRIVALLQGFAPTTARVIRPPAPATELQRALSVLPAGLPTGLLGWWAPASPCSRTARHWSPSAALSAADCSVPIPGPVSGTAA